jgi:diguanylate cyclase (GGDEF)-like protein
MKPGLSKIGRRIVALVFLAVVISITVVTSLFLWLQLRDNLGIRRSAIESTGFVYASAMADAVAAGDRESAYRALRSITRVPDVVYAVAIDGQGKEIAGLGTKVVLDDDVASAESSTYAVLTSGSMAVSVDIVRAGIPAGRLVVVSDISGLRAQLFTAMAWTVLASLGAGLAGVGMAVRLQRRITAPLLSLTGAMRHVRDSADYGAKVDHRADDETGILVDAFNGMITEIRTRDARLARLAYFDDLTSLPNRLQLSDRLKSLAQDQPAAFFLLDIDDFKLVNETYGMSFGDNMIRAVADVLRSEACEAAFLARIGSDQYAIVVTGIDTEADAQEELAPYLAAFLKPMTVEGREMFAKVSAGVALIPRDGTTPEEILRHADLALNSVAEAKIGSVQIYRPALDENVQERTAVANDLRNAIESGEFQAAYQPQVDLSTGAVTGFESLVRWTHPTRGPVSPGLFIPVAEATGLVQELGLWMLRESCAQAKAWIDSAEPMGQISVNVSAAQILQSDFHADVARILAESGLPASHLCLELTESLFAGQSSAQARKVLEEIDRMGVTLAIDDFGTGYSSMAYLKDLPFDKLKIDRAFVSDIDSDPYKRRLLKGMVDLAHALEMSIVAEGAETDAEIRCLIDLRVEEVQGYAMSRPVPAAEAMAAASRIVSEFPERFALSPRRPKYAGAMPSL